MKVPPPDTYTKPLSLWYDRLERDIISSNLKIKPTEIIVSKSGCKFVEDKLVHTNDCSCDDEYDEVAHSI